MRVKVWPDLNDLAYLQNKNTFYKKWSIMQMALRRRYAEAKVQESTPAGVYQFKFMSLTDAEIKLSRSQFSIKQEQIRSGQQTIYRQLL